MDDLVRISPLLAIVFTTAMAIVSIYVNAKVNSTLKNIDVGIKNRELAFTLFKYYSEEITKTLSNIADIGYGEAESPKINVQRARLVRFLDAIGLNSNSYGHIFARDTFALESDFNRWKVDLAEIANECLVNAGQRLYATGGGNG